MTEYLVVGLSVLLWCFVLDRNMPKSASKWQIARTLCLLIVLWPVLLRVVFEETKEIFK